MVTSLIVDTSKMLALFVYNFVIISNHFEIIIVSVNKIVIAPVISEYP